MGVRWELTGREGPPCCVLLAMLVGALVLPAATHAGPPDLRIVTRAGARIALEPEELQGPSARPLLATRDRLNERFKREFLWFFKVRIPDGTAVVGRWTADGGPLRVTMYEITKNEGSPRWLRVVGTRVYQKGEIAEIQTVLKKSAEHWLVSNLLDPQWIVSVRVE